MDAKEKTYLSLATAINESGKSLEEIGKEIGLFKQSLSNSINKRTLRLETLYILESLFKRKIVYSQYDITSESKIDKLMEKMISIEKFILNGKPNTI
jgi:tetrahydromethanopterin S-methyltransferase subunit H